MVLLNSNATEDKNTIPIGHSLDKPLMRRARKSFTVLLSTEILSVHTGADADGTIRGRRH